MSRWFVTRAMIDLYLYRLAIGYWPMNVRKRGRRRPRQQIDVSKRYRCVVAGVVMLHQVGK